MSHTQQREAPNVKGITVAIAVESLGDAVALYRMAFGLPEPRYASSPADAIEVAFFEFGDSQLQLISPTSEESIVAKDIDDRGAGLHHFGLVVGSVDRALARLASHDLRTLGDRGRPGAGDLVVGFVHPKAVGALVELVEKPSEQ